MKSIICVLFVLASLNAQWQDIIYDKDCSHLLQYEGEWKFQSATEEVFLPVGFLTD